MKTFCILLLLSFSLCFAQLEMTCVNVGQGDSIFIKTPNGLKILIDAGSASDADSRDSNALTNICEVLSQNGVSTSSPLDYIIITHFHGDHYTLIDEVIQRFGLPKIAVLDRGGDKKWDGSSLGDFPQSLISAIATKRSTPALGTTFDFGSGCTMQLIAAGYPDFANLPDKRVKVLGELDEKLSGEYENGKSLVFTIRWNGFDILLTGDSNEEVEPYVSSFLQKNGIAIDVLKVGHHGSDTSTTDAFLMGVMPEVAVCSVGHAASYQHPRRASYDRLYAHRSIIFQTNLGYDGALSYSIPPEHYGNLANGNVSIVYHGGTEYTVKTPGQEYVFMKDE